MGSRGAWQNRNAAQKRIEKENELMAKRLERLKKEPPAAFHAKGQVPNMHRSQV